MKLLSNKTLLAILLLVSGYGYIVSCTHDDTIPPPPASTGITYTPGTAVFLPGNLTAGNASEWKLDKAHSSVLWTTSYRGVSGLLTGRFNQFGVHNILPAEMTTYATTGQPLPDTSWAFYEGDDSKTYFNGYVQINTSNTGEPGRDAGCNLNPGSLNAPAIISGTQNLSANNIARIQTTKVAFDKTTGDYIVNLNLTWNDATTSVPVTKALVGRLKFIPRTNPPGLAYDYFGLQLKFQFNCRDFGVTSKSVADKMDIECNMNFNNK